MVAVAASRRAKGASHKARINPPGEIILREFFVKQRQQNAKRASRPNPRVDRQPKLVVDNAPTRVEVLPRNLAQEAYVDMLDDVEKSVVVASGPAGTGKTLLATRFALRELQRGNIKKIILTRPAVSVDEQHGFLPGTLLEKMAPWVIPIMDVVKEHYPVHVVERMLEDETIEIAPLAFMRGRTLKNAIVLFDEAQNATPNQMKMMLTRIGDNSRVIITGDIAQHDRGYDDNGLKDFIARLERSNSRRIAVAKFTSEDVERHPVIEEVLNLYGE